MKRIFLFLCIGLSLSTASLAQRQLTLDDCRSLALQNNTKIKTARLEVSGAKEMQREALTKYFPNISAAGTGFKADKGAVGLSVLNGMYSTSFVDRGVMAGVTAVQPIFAGGQILNGNKLAKVNASVKSEQLRLSEDEAVLTVEQYYWQWVSLKEKLKTLDVVGRQIDTIRRDVSTAVDAGVAMQNDLLQVELERNRISANRLKVNNGLSVVKMLLAQAIELPADSFDIAVSVPEDLPDPNIYKVDHQAALQLTPTYRMLQKGVEASKLQRNMELGKRLPTIGIGAGYMYYDLPDQHSISVIENRRSMGMVFASIAIPLSDWWGGTHAIRQKNVQLKIAEESKRSNSELLLVQMQQLWNELVEAYDQAKISKESVVKATENARISTNCYHAGTVAISDLLNAQSLLQQSRDQYTDDLTTYFIKRTRYLQATGR